MCLFPRLDLNSHLQPPKQLESQANSTMPSLVLPTPPFPFFSPSPLLYMGMDLFHPGWSPGPTTELYSQPQSAIFQ